MHEPKQAISPSSQAITELSAEATACCSPGEGPWVANVFCATLTSESALLGGNLTPAHKIQHLHADQCRYPFFQENHFHRRNPVRPCSRSRVPAEQGHPPGCAAATSKSQANSQLS